MYCISKTFFAQLYSLVLGQKSESQCDHCGASLLQTEFKFVNILYYLDVQVTSRPVTD